MKGLYLGHEAFAEDKVPNTTQEKKLLLAKEVEL
jgi:hypothetical protein